jgi:Ca-activated chloride channel homolog
MFRALCTLLLVVVLAAAQPVEESLSVDVDLVNIYLTVCNRKGHLVADLGRERFAVFEDGRPQVITHFSRQTDVPLTIVLLIDTSGSVRDKMSFEKEAAAEFLYTTLHNGRDKAALMTFDSFLELRQDYTTDSALLAMAVKRIIAGGGTRLYDALHFVIENKLGGSDERKVIVLLTDGDDKSSVHSPREVVDEAHRNNVSIYAVSTNAFGMKPSAADQSDQMLEMLASETGGEAFFPNKVRKLGSSFRKIADELRSQYSMAYRSTNQRRDGTFRRIRVETARNHYLIRTRSGYFAPLQNAQK